MVSISLLLFLLLWTGGERDPLFVAVGAEKEGGGRGGGRTPSSWHIGQPLSRAISLLKYSKSSHPNVDISPILPSKPFRAPKAHVDVHLLDPRQLLLVDSSGTKAHNGMGRSQSPLNAPYDTRNPVYNNPMLASKLRCNFELSASKGQGVETVTRLILFLSVLDTEIQASVFQVNMRPDDCLTHVIPDTLRSPTGPRGREKDDSEAERSIGTFPNLFGEGKVPSSIEKQNLLASVVVSLKKAVETHPYKWRSLVHLVRSGLVSSDVLVLVADARRNFLAKGEGLNSRDVLATLPSSVNEFPPFLLLGRNFRLFSDRRHGLVRVEETKKPADEWIGVNAAFGNLELWRRRAQHRPKLPSCDAAMASFVSDRETGKKRGGQTKNSNGRSEEQEEEADECEEFVSGDILRPQCPRWVGVLSLEREGLHLAFKPVDESSAVPLTSLNTGELLLSRDDPESPVSSLPSESSPDSSSFLASGEEAEGKADEEGLEEPGAEAGGEGDGSLKIVALDFRKLGSDAAFESSHMKNKDSLTPCDNGKSSQPGAATETETEDGKVKEEKDERAPLCLTSPCLATDSRIEVTGGESGEIITLSGDFDFDACKDLVSNVFTSPEVVEALGILPETARQRASGRLAVTGVSVRKVLRAVGLKTDPQMSGKSSDVQILEGALKEKCKQNGGKEDSSADESAHSNVCFQGVFLLSLLQKFSHVVKGNLSRVWMTEAVPRQGGAGAPESNPDWSFGIVEEFLSRAPPLSIVAQAPRLARREFGLLPPGGLPLSPFTTDPNRPPPVISGSKTVAQVISKSVAEGVKQALENGNYVVKQTQLPLLSSPPSPTPSSPVPEAAESDQGEPQAEVQTSGVMGKGRGRKRDSDRGTAKEKTFSSQTRKRIRGPLEASKSLPLHQTSEKEALKGTAAGGNKKEGTANENLHRHTWSLRLQPVDLD